MVNAAWALAKQNYNNDNFNMGRVLRVGLVIFDLNKDAPQFSIRVRAQRFSPDMFYVNEFADRLKHNDAATFEELFG